MFSRETVVEIGILMEETETTKTDQDIRTREEAAETECRDTIAVELSITIIMATAITIVIRMEVEISVVEIEAGSVEEVEWEVVVTRMDRAWITTVKMHQCKLKMFKNNFFLYYFFLNI